MTRWDEIKIVSWICAIGLAINFLMAFADWFI